MHVDGESAGQQLRERHIERRRRFAIDDLFQRIFYIAGNWASPNMNVRGLRDTRRTDFDADHHVGFIVAFVGQYGRAGLIAVTTCAELNRKRWSGRARDRGAIGEQDPPDTADRLTQGVTWVLVVLPIVDGPTVVRDLGCVIFARRLADQLGIDAFLCGRRAIGIQDGPTRGARIVTIANRRIERVFGVDVEYATLTIGKHIAQCRFRQRERGGLGGDSGGGR